MSKIMNTFFEYFLKETYTPIEILGMWDIACDEAWDVNYCIYHNTEEMVLNFLVFMGVDV